jgi:predicted outer membrane protein
VAEKCLADAKKSLGEKQGREFDHHFVGLQIVKHQAMQSKLAVFERHASSELRQIISDASKTTTKHLEQAEELKEQLGDAPQRTARQERRRERRERNE